VREAGHPPYRYRKTEHHRVVFIERVVFAHGEVSVLPFGTRQSPLRHAGFVGCRCWEFFVGYLGF
jgi:hypothetical protein